MSLPPPPIHSGFPHNSQWAFSKREMHCISFSYTHYPLLDCQCPGVKDAVPNKSYRFLKWWPYCLSGLISLSSPHLCTTHTTLVNRPSPPLPGLFLLSARFSPQPTSPPTPTHSADFGPNVTSGSCPRSLPPIASLTFTSALVRCSWLPDLPVVRVMIWSFFFQTPTPERASGTW